MLRLRMSCACLMFAVAVASRDSDGDETVVPSTIAQAKEDEDPFADLIKPDSRAEVGKTVAAAPQRLPRTMRGIVVDQSDIPLAAAIVTLKLYRVHELFDADESDTKEQWKSTTNIQGVCSFQLEEVLVGPEDDLELHVVADGYFPSSVKIPFKDSFSWKLPKLQLEILKNAPSSGGQVDPWAGWVDDTDDFKAEVAATINGVPLLIGQVLDRYSAYLIDARRQMQQQANVDGGKGFVQTPEDYEQLRAELIQRELPVHVQRTVLVRYFIANLTPEERIETNSRIDALFETELEKLKKELSAATIEELESELGKRKTTINNVKNHFALEQLAVMCVLKHAQQTVPVSEQEIRDYYDSHGAEFTLPQTVDWRMLSFQLSPSLNTDEAIEKLEGLLSRLNDGDPCEVEIEKFANEGAVLRECWNGTKPDSLANEKLRSQLSIVPVDHWCLVHEEYSGSPSNSQTEKNAMNQQLVTNFGTITVTNAGFQAAPHTFKTYELAQAFPRGGNPMFAGGPVQIDENRAPRVNPVLTNAAAQFEGTRVYLVHVSARREMSRIPFEKARDGIRDTLEKRQAEERHQVFLEKAFSTVKIESKYTLPKFARGDSSNDPAEDANSDSRNPGLPTVQIFEWSRDKSLSPAVHEFDAAVLWKTLVDYDTLIVNDSQSASAYLGRGSIRLRIGKLDQAIEDFTTAIRLDPKLSKPYGLRAYTRIQRGDFENALTDCAQAIALDPANDDAYFLRAQIWIRKGDLEKFLADINESIRLNPNEAQSCNCLAWWLAAGRDDRHRDGGKAVELATRACIQTKWQNDEYVNTLAIALAEVGKFAEAQDRLQQAIDMAPRTHASSRAKMMSLFEDSKPYRVEGDLNPQATY